MTIQEIPESGRGGFGKSDRAQWALISAVFIIILGWVYFPVLTSNYGWNDDYQLLKRVGEGSFNLRDSEFVAGGRPILGLGNLFLFSIPQSIDGLKLARIFSVAGIIIFAITAFAIFRAGGFDRLFSTAASLLMCLTPGFAVYAGWLTEGLNSYAATLALIAGQWIATATDGTDARRRVVHCCVGGMLLLLVYATYQPVAAFAIIPLLARAWRGYQVDWQRLRNFFIGVTMLMAVAAFYFIAFKLVASFFHFGAQAERATLTTNLPANLHFVMTQVLWSGLTGWFQFHSRGWQGCCAIAVGALIVAGCVMKPWKSFAAQVCALLSLAVVFAITILPLLLVKEQTFVFRTQTAFHAAIAFALVIGLERLLQNVVPSLAARWRVVGLAGLVCMAAFMTRFHLYRDFVAVNERELAMLKQGIENWKEFPKSLVYIVPAQSTLPDDDVGEFKDMTAALPWVAPAMLELVFIDKFEKQIPLRAALQNHAAFSVQYGPRNPDSLPVLDGFALLNGESAVISDPYWGSIRTNRNGWCCSDWFGVFDNRHFPSVYHSQLGWLNCSGKGGDDFWFGSGRYGWFWTTPKSYPSLMFKERGSWFFLAPAIQISCSFYDLERKVWTFSPQDKIPSK